MEQVLEDNNIKWYKRLEDVPDRILSIAEIYLPEYEQMVWLDAKDYHYLESIGEI